MTKQPKKGEFWTNQATGVAVAIVKCDATSVAYVVDGKPGRLSSGITTFLKTHQRRV